MNTAVVLHSTSICTHTQRRAWLKLQCLADNKELQKQVSPKPVGYENAFPNRSSAPVCRANRGWMQSQICRLVAIRFYRGDSTWLSDIGSGCSPGDRRRRQNYAGWC